MIAFGIQVIIQFLNLIVQIKFIQNVEVLKNSYIIYYIVELPMFGYPLSVRKSDNK
jgi:hypothetical protein